MARHICWPWGNYPGLSRKASCNFKGSNMLRLEMQETQVQSLVRRSPWRRTWQPTPGFSPGNPMDRGAWQATVHGVAKSQTQLCTHTCMHACNMREKAFFFFFFFFWLIQVACGILVPQSVIDPHPLQWKLRVLTTGPPGNSQGF